MSFHENSRYLSETDSNIPKLRRIHHVNRKHKSPLPLPEISKYIETIITSSGGYHEVSGISFKKFSSKKHSKDRKKFESKSEEKPREKLVEATRTCEKRSKVSAEDLRYGTKRRKTEKIEMSDEIKILKKLYPNPYELEKIDEFKILKSIKASREKIMESQSKDQLNEEEKTRKACGRMAMKKLPALIKSMTEHRSTTTISTISQSSPKESEEKNFKGKLLKSNIYVIDSTHLREASATINPENIKLSQLKKENRTKDKVKGQELMKHSGPTGLLKTNPRILSRIYEYKKLQHLEDLQQIYEIMNKVTESYLKITSKVIDIKYGSLMNESSSTEMIAVNRSIKQQENSKFTESTKKLHETQREEKKEDKNTENNKKIDTTIVSSQIVLLEPKIEETPFFEDPDFMKTTQKIDEVLEFMYKFIQDFSAKEIPVRSNKKKQSGKASNQKPAKPSLGIPLKSKTPKVTSRENKAQEDVCQIRSFTHIRRPTETSTPDASKTNIRPRGRRKQNSPSHSSRISLTASTGVQQLPRLESILSPSNSTNRYLNIRCESSDLTIQNEFQTVEGQNELGGCNESEDSLIFNNDSRLPKQITPLSVKPKVSNVNSCKVIKSALETEEKLMANLGPKSSQNDRKKPVKSLMAKESFADIFISKTQARTFSFFNLSPRTSNFVVCVNSLPPFMRTNLRRKVARPYPSAIIGETNFSREKKHSVTKKSLKKIGLKPEGKVRVRRHSYVLREERVMELFVAKIRHSLTVFNFSKIFYVARSNDSFSLKNSETPILIEIIPAKEAFTVDSFTDPSLNLESNFRIVSENMKSVNSSAKISSCKKISPTSVNNNGSVNEIRFEMKEAEDSILVIEESRSNEMMNNDIKSLKNSDSSLDKELDTRKIYDLLLRTQNLQTKLRKYLNKMTFTHPVSLPSFLMGDYEKVSKHQTKDSQNSTSSLVNWCEKIPPKRENAEKVHDSTSYHLPEVSAVDEKTLDEVLNVTEPEKAVEEPEKTQPETQEENTVAEAEDKDDRSSVCSFKSSVEYSETNDTFVNEETKCEPKTKNDFKSMTMFKKFFNDVDVFKNQIFKSNKESEVKKEDEKEKETEKDKDKDKEKENENKKVEVCESSPASDPKALKTIFKGKESVTELSIGFKGVPLNKINNISVEKKKYSPNHTKVSICIFKESGGLLPGTSKSEESTFTTGNTTNEKEISTYYLDHFRPSISSSITEYSRGEDISNRSYDLRKSDSEDEEDDFKSVASTLSDTEISKKKKKHGKEDLSRKVNKSGAKRKHRFEFYQKMEPRLEEGTIKSRHKPSPYKLMGCKELEPVQQALTELQMRMRSIKRDSFFSSTKYYKKALKLAKMSAGYCQSCGNRSVIPDDTFGLYKTILPRGLSNHRNCCYLKAALSPNTSYYSICASRKDLGERFCDLSLKHSSSYLHKTKHSLLGNSFHEVPVFWERI